MRILIKMDGGLIEEILYTKGSGEPKVDVIDTDLPDVEPTSLFLTGVEMEEVSVMEYKRHIETYKKLDEKRGVESNAPDVDHIVSLAEFYEEHKDKMSERLRNVIRRKVGFGGELPVKDIDEAHMLNTRGVGLKTSREWHALKEEYYG